MDRRGLHGATWGACVRASESSDWDEQKRSLVCRVPGWSGGLSRARRGEAVLLSTNSDCVTFLLHVSTAIVPRLSSCVVASADHDAAAAAAARPTIRLSQASAFFAGMTRMTISLAVTMVELTDDVRFLLPIMVSVIIAKVVADTIMHPLYHALLEVKCIPYLPDKPKYVSLCCRGFCHCCGCWCCC
jgi:hypothetical protein